jgi:hypothetical protein
MKKRKKKKFILVIDQIRIKDEKKRINKNLLITRSDRSN